LVLSNPKVQQRISELCAERNARNDIDADYVLRRLAEEVAADIKDIYDENNHLKPVHDWPAAFRRGLVTQIRTTKLYGQGEERGTQVGERIDVIFVDRVRRLELLGRHIKVNAFDNKVTIGLDTPLQELFKQIAGSVIRPASEARQIEHRQDEAPPIDRSAEPAEILPADSPVRRRR
jgi:phage terminase small subunit